MSDHRSHDYAKVDDDLRRMTDNAGMTDDEHDIVVGKAHKAATNMFKFDWFASAAMHGVAWEHREMWHYAAVHAIGQWSVHGDAHKAASEGIKAMGDAVSTDCYGRKHDGVLQSDRPWSSYVVTDDDSQIPFLERAMAVHEREEDVPSMNRDLRIREALVEATSEMLPFGNMSMMEALETYESVGNLAHVEAMAGNMSHGTLAKRLHTLRAKLAPLYQEVYG